ncbi:MAG: HAD-IA family hydrolase [Thiohalocapsa sp.]
MNYNLLVFDWDGTLMDSAARIIASVTAAFDDVGAEPPAPRCCREVIGLGLNEAMLRLWPESTTRQRKELMDRYRHHYLVANDTPTPLFPGTREALAALHQADYLMAVATGKGRRGLDAALDQTGLGPLFHATRCADETFSKPHPQMLTELMDELGAGAADSLMIGDTEFDLQMAMNAGVGAVAVSCGTHESRRLTALQPLACLASVEDLPDWLRHGHID